MNENGRVQMCHIVATSAAPMQGGMPLIGKLNTSCDVIVVNHFSCQAIVFE